MRDHRFGSVAFHTIVLASLAWIGCSTRPAPTGETAAPSGWRTPALAVRANVAHVNDDLKVPSFVWLTPPSKLPPGSTPISVAWGTLNGAAPALKLGSTAIQAAHVASVHDTGAGAIVTRFGQTVDGVDVFRAQLNVAMRRDLMPIGITGSLAPSLRRASGAWSLDARTAVAAAYKALTGHSLAPSVVAQHGNAAGFDKYVFTVGGAITTFANARVKRVWYPSASSIIPAYYVELGRANSVNTDSKLDSFVIGAGKGELLFRHNMVAADKYSYRVWADSTGPNGLAPMDSPYGNGLTPNASGTFDPNAMPPSYLFPSLVNLQNVPFSKNDPWLDPGVADLTFGNNVSAYADLVAPDGFTTMSADVAVPPSSANTFDYSWNPSTLPNANQNNIEAVTTNLFFVINYMHDLFYDSGYDEVSGNAQLHNYGRGGVEGDPVLAESQDFSGLDNANCQTPSDGDSPRIQMYLWDLGGRPSHHHHAAVLARDLDHRRHGGLGRGAVGCDQRRRTVRRRGRRQGPGLRHDVGRDDQSDARGRRCQRRQRRRARRQDRAHRSRHLRLLGQGRQRARRRRCCRAHRQQRDRRHARQLWRQRVPQPDLVPGHAGHVHRRAEHQDCARQRHGHGRPVQGAADPRRLGRRHHHVARVGPFAVAPPHRRRRTASTATSRTAWARAGATSSRC